MTLIPIGDYRPDLPAYIGTHTTVNANVYWRPDGSAVAPLKAGSAVTTALAAQPISAFIARKGNGAVFLYASAAYRATIYRKYGNAWAGYFTGATGNATPFFPWRFCQFGERVVATNPVNGLVSQTIGSQDDFTAISGAPAAAFIATLEPGFVMLGYTDDGTRQYPNRLHWSSLNDATVWPTVGTSAAAAAQSDTQDLPQGGAITGILSAVGGASGCVLTESVVYRVEYVGAPVVFAFREAARGVGNVCVNAAISVNGLAYFISEDGFQRFDGQSVAPIGQGRVSATFWAEVDRENLHRVNVAHDPLRKIIVWAYPTSAATSGNPNKWLIYSYAVDKWTHADDAGVTCSLLFSCVQDRYPLDLLDGYFPPNPDGTSISWDGPTVNGGAPLLASFNSSFILVTHTGSNLAARAETGETDAQGRRVYCDGIRPITDASSATAQVGYRDTLSAGISYTTATAIGPDAVCPQRIDTRYARARVNIPAGATWTYLAGADVAVSRTGRR